MRKGCSGKVLSLSVLSLLPIVALGPNPLPESLQWVSPLPHNYTLPSLPLLLPGCHRNQPAMSRPVSRRGDHPVSFPCSPEPAPSSGLVLFRTLRDTRLWWRSQKQTGSGVCHGPVGQICCPPVSRAVGTTQTSAPQDTHEPVPVPATLRALPGRAASSPGGLWTEDELSSAKFSGQLRSLEEGSSK